MKNIINNFLLYIQFFTRIPVNKGLNCEDKNFIEGTPFFPIIGLIIGGFQYVVYYSLSTKLNSFTLAIIAVFISIIITGALHLDGFGDCADGFFAFKGGKEKIIEIMKDSRVGAFGCIAIVFNILLKVSLIDSTINTTPLLIIAAPIIGRFSIVFLSYIGKSAKPQGTGNLFIGKVKVRNLIYTLLITGALTYLLIGYRAILLIVTSMLVTYLFNKFCEKKIEGLSGDTLGANNEIVEIFTLIMYFIFTN